MIVCSWNINSVRMRESLLLELIDSLDPDVIFLQEIKCQDNEFPSVDKKNEYSLVINGEKGKYGVAILIKKKLLWVIFPQTFANMLYPINLNKF